jgi:ubiquinone/menaquinone biosynthesis C-methylase UbiE
MKKSIVEATHTADKVQTYYTWRASNYDAGAGFEAEHHQEAIRLAEVQAGQRVLDADCGTGRASVGLALAVGAAGHLDALDLTQAMLDKARGKIEKAGLAGRVTFKQGDANHLPYPDATFDVLYNGYMFDLIHLDGFMPILKEFFRVLKPGGNLVLVNMSKPDEHLTFYERVYAKGWAVMPCRPVLMGPYLEQAGFSDIRRNFRPGRFSLVSLLWGTEIVLARK